MRCHFLFNTHSAPTGNYYHAYWAKNRGEYWIHTYTLDKEARRGMLLMCQYRIARCVIVHYLTTIYHVSISSVIFSRLQIMLRWCAVSSVKQTPRSSQYLKTSVWKNCLRIIHNWILNLLKYFNLSYVYIHINTLIYQHIRMWCVVV